MPSLINIFRLKFTKLESIEILQTTNETINAKNATTSLRQLRTWFYMSKLYFIACWKRHRVKKLSNAEPQSFTLLRVINGVRSRRYPRKVALEVRLYTDFSKLTQDKRKL